MTKKEIKEMLQGWIDDINSSSLPMDYLPKKCKKMRDAQLDAFLDGVLFALENVVSQL